MGIQALKASAMQFEMTVPGRTYQNRCTGQLLLWIADKQGLEFVEFQRVQVPKYDVHSVPKAIVGIPNALEEGPFLKSQVESLFTRTIP